MAAPFRVTVSHRKVVHVVDEFGDSGLEVVGFPTIDALFDSALTALEYGHAVRICYDSRFGYPNSFATTEVGSEWSTVFVTTVSKLHPLP